MAGELTQVISNLISNATDAVDVGGAIRVRLGCVEGEGPTTVRVSIEDNGSGIAPEHLKNIFEPFFTTKKDVGTGLGLFVAKEIVERHGGSIQVHTQHLNGSAGSVFNIHLPVPTGPQPDAN
jgi:signal transduction histidine kinase